MTTTQEQDTAELRRVELEAQIETTMEDARSAWEARDVPSAHMLDELADALTEELEELSA